MTFSPRITARIAAIVAAVALLAAAAFTTIGAGSPAVAQTSQKNIVETAVAAGQFDTLVSLAKKAGLAGALTGDDKLTVFAPTDAAFKKVPKKTLAKLARSKSLLKKVLLYHVVAGDVKSPQVVKLRSAKTLNGKRVRISVRDGKVYLNRKSRITKVDVAASNGTIHVIDRVLMPPTS